MKFTRDEICYILENNEVATPAKVMRRQGNFYIIQLVGHSGAIRLPESRLFKSEEEALQSRKEEKKEETYPGYIDVFGDKRVNRNPHSFD